MPTLIPPRDPCGGGCVGASGCRGSSTSDVLWQARAESGRDISSKLWR